MSQEGRGVVYSLQTNPDTPKQTSPDDPDFQNLRGVGNRGWQTIEVKRKYQRNQRNLLRVRSQSRQHNDAR